MLTRASTPTRQLLAAATIAGALVAFAPQTAEAFCGFYVSSSTGDLTNDATQVVLMRDGLRTIQTMQNNYRGPAEDFAMVIPVPVVLKKEQVKTLHAGVVTRLERLGAPRLVEYWEQNPCPVPSMIRHELESPVQDLSGSARDPSGIPSGAGGGYVAVKAAFTAGEYEVVILESNDATTLDGWLRDRKYNIPKGAKAALAPYIAQGMYFFVAKVDVGKVKGFKGGEMALSPLRFHYDAKDFSLPIRLGLLNAKGVQDLIVHILARGQRYEVANYENVTIPTNLDVTNDVRGYFGSFYSSLLDFTLWKNPGAVVTEYAWAMPNVRGVKCDPCPSGPQLTAADLLALGAEVLPADARDGFTLTRLHARYTDEIKSDLMFSAAPPITGGREVYLDTNELERGSRPGGTNNFQGRYAIRHLWKGPIRCKSPRRGVWGAPASGVPTQTLAATRMYEGRKVNLTFVLRTHAPEIGVKANSTTRRDLRKTTRKRRRGSKR